mgnify:CR=1 FL=1
MKCKNCGEELLMYETFEDYSEDVLRVEEHWECHNCDRTFAREMTYKLIKKGDLEE